MRIIHTKKRKKWKPTKAKLQAPITVCNSDGSQKLLTAIEYKALIHRNESQKSFYLYHEWRELRYQALREQGGRCCLCGRSARDGITLHVDHIKPRSKFPNLALDITNLQVLCEECNIGKGNKDDIDWR
jgi:hypothetical protein